MADSSLQERLREHAKAFDGLMSLIPAKMYYGNGDDPSEQWSKKKKTKEEKKAARRANLDPDNELNKSVKEVMDERARIKRKLEEEEDDEDISGIEKETPGQGLKKAVEKPAKKPKLDTTPAELDEDALAAKKDKDVLKQKKREEKTARKAEKLQAKGEKHVGGDVTQEAAVPKQQPAKSPKKPSTGAPKPSKNTVLEDEVDEDDQVHEPTEDAGEDELQATDFSGLTPDMDAPDDSSPDSTPKSPTFDTNPPTNGTAAEIASTTTSISSAVAPSEKPKHIKIPSDTTALRARLAARIEQLRAARKADVEGKPIRTRQELIESRREKQAQRKAHKKELRRQAKIEEEAKREEALLSARNSPGMSPLMGLPRDDDGSANHFAFGRVAFADGTEMSRDLTYVKDGSGKKKGPVDPKGQLAKLEAQKKRVAGMDEDKRKEVLEKETWLAARRRAEGVKVHDDEALLKKAVKRKEKTKKKSEREWKERTKGVEDAMKQRQKKREDNLRKRKDEKNMSKGQKKAAAKARKGRAGFEGTFGKRK